MSGHHFLLYCMTKIREIDKFSADEVTDLFERNE